MTLTFGKLLSPPSKKSSLVVSGAVFFAGGLVMRFLPGSHHTTLSEPLLRLGLAGILYGLAEADITDALTRWGIRGVAIVIWVSALMESFPK